MAGAIRLLVWIALIVCAPAVMLAQGGVSVTLFRPPPNQLAIADLWKVDLNNTTDRSYTVYLHGSATEATDGLIVDARSREFVLPARTRMRVTGSMLEPITVDEWNNAYKATILRSGRVPTGDYRVCVEVLVAGSDSLLGTDCYDQSIEQLSPPILVFPLDESVVTLRLPTFNWLPPAPVRSGDMISYQLRIVEVLGRQTALDAMASNPAFFDLRNITTNSLRYPLGARGFEVGRTYAWQIRAFMPQRMGDRQPIGESEIWWFTYGVIGEKDGGGDDDDRGNDDDRPELGDRTPPTLPGLRDPDISVGDRTTPPITRERVTVLKDQSLKPGFIPPNINLNEVVAKPIYALNPMVLRALLHTCQGAD